MREPGWNGGEAFLILRACDVPAALSEGIISQDGYRVILADADLAAAFGAQIIGPSHAVLRVDLTDLADRIDPDAPPYDMAFISMPPVAGHYTCLRGRIPAHALSEIDPVPAPAGP